MRRPPDPERRPQFFLEEFFALLVDGRRRKIGAVRTLIARCIALGAKFSGRHKTETDSKARQDDRPKCEKALAQNADLTIIATNLIQSYFDT
jgi:hypothetical protein